MTAFGSFIVEQISIEEVIFQKLIIFVYIIPTIH